MSVLDNEIQLCQLYCEFYAKIKKTISVEEKFDLGITEITQAILMRMSIYYLNHELNKAVLKKGKLQSASDFFVETVLYYLHKVLKDKYTVFSEKTLAKGFVPDISIWKDDKCIAIIECKTQLGYNRSGYLFQHQERKCLLRKIYPEAKAYLLVMTNMNWGKNKGFSQQDRLECPKELFSLCKVWPSNFELDNIVPNIQDKLEDLLIDLLS